MSKAFATNISFAETERNDSSLTVEFLRIEKGEKLRSFSQRISVDLQFVSRLARVRVPDGREIGSETFDY